MNWTEITHLLIAFVILAIVITFGFFIDFNGLQIGLGIITAAVLVFVHVGAKKLTAWLLDAGVEHRIWFWERYGFKPGWHFKKPLPMGIILPLLFTVFSLGMVKVMTLLTYEATALKRRAAKRFGHFSFTEMTDFHHALIGASGIAAVLILVIITVFFPAVQLMAKMGAFYAFFNMIPFSKLDGSHILSGARIIWSVLALISVLFAAFALFLP